MGHNFFTNLPSEIITNILLRLCVRSIAISKCVCISWLDLLKTDEFINSHHSKSAPALAVLMPQRRSNWCTVFEIVDEFDLRSDDRRYNPLIKSNFPHRAAIKGAANGFLLLQTSLPETLYVCNPITRDYVELCRPPPPHVSIYKSRTAYGFGASKTSGTYKAVRITSKSNCHVYTLGTGMWRRLQGNAWFDYEYAGSTFGTFINGNLHWIVFSNSDGSLWISCFDVETECFTTFSTPASYGKLSALRDCLCLCDNTLDHEYIIWMMKEYGVDNSWTKEYVISQNPCFNRYGYECVYPIKVFKNGDILMLWDKQFLFYYSNETGTSQEIGVFDARDDYINSILVTPSFVSLKSFGMENVISY